ncbi:LysR family transcriptional regulator [Microbulbifer agarilyticus]
MNIQHLKLFVRVAATRNISQAGKELGLSAAVASAHLNKLEESVGVRLLNRTTRKVSLTEEGEAFLPHAEDVLESVAAAEASVGSARTMPSGVLRIAAPASFGRMHLVPALADFMAEYPNLRVDLRLSDAMVDLVEGGFDIAIRNAKLLDSSLIARKLASDRRIVCAAPSYLEKFGFPESPRDLERHRCLHLSGLDTWEFADGAGSVRIKTSGALRADNGEVVRDACVAGLGIAQSSVWCVYEQLAAGELVELLNDYPSLSDTSIWAVYPSSRLLALKVKAFVDFLAGFYGEPPYWEALSNRDAGRL